LGCSLGLALAALVTGIKNELMHHQQAS